jgi:hypothetical protein
MKVSANGRTLEVDGKPRYEGITVGFYFAGACGRRYGHGSVWQMWQPGKKPVLADPGANLPKLPGEFR